MKPWEKSKAVEVLKSGGVIAYPTEAVYGLGCDPFNGQAVARILKIKNRSKAKGLILVASNWEQIEKFCSCLSEPQKKKLSQVDEKKPITWLIPDYENLIPEWIKGKHKKFALRISTHPVVRELCEAFDGPIVSTSANFSGAPPVKTKIKIFKMSKDQIDFIVPGKLGASISPSEITDIESGRVIRAYEEGH